MSVLKHFFLSFPSKKTCITKSQFFIICMRFTYYIIQFILRIQSTIIIKKSVVCVFVRFSTHDGILDGMLAFYTHYFYIMHLVNHFECAEIIIRPSSNKLCYHIHQTNPIKPLSYKYHDLTDRMYKESDYKIHLAFFDTSKIFG